MTEKQKLPAQMRKTQQKDCVRQILENADGPVSISQIFESASKNLPRIGIATVYRIVSKMLEEGEIQKVEIPGSGTVHYEVSEISKHHHHFFCSKCNKTFDLAKCPLPENLNKFALPGFHIETHELTLYGTCANCTKKK